MTEPTNLGRREFVKWSAAGVIAGRVVVQAPGIRRDDRIRGANERVVVALIGAGRQGVSDLGNAIKQPDTEVAAVCDVYAPNLANGLQAAPGAKSYTDFRRVLERNDIDAVIIATPDHWHPLQTVLACEAGKDVYVEKPISVSIAEGRRMVDAARRYKRVVQTGTQQRSGKHFQQAAELVKAGRIGAVTQVRTWNFGNESPDGIGNPPDSAPPPELDWDLWLGPATKRPFNPNRFGVFPDRWSSFRWFWDYAGGMMTDWGVHWLDIVQLVMNVDSPRFVSTSGGKFVLRDNRETPDTILATFQYPGFICTYENRVTNAAPLSGKTNGMLFHGTDGTLFVDRQGLEIFPETRKAGETAVNRTEGLKVENSNQHHLDHMKDFIECVRSRKTPIADIETGHRSTTTALLGNIAYRTGHRIEWDGARERIIGDGTASAHLMRDYRRPWKL
ncbi:MAG TPA: Gfo/Idh/MocA family oxidoreductase [Gemmatimonadaceae bacterium]|nr:Gfo/Idh/MocA family oxidoreductase [Gemmatimonadaceae bacterium]